MNTAVEEYIDAAFRRAREEEYPPDLCQAMAREQCPNKADWILYLYPCHCQVPHCDKHKQQVDEKLNLGTRPGAWAACVSHGHKKIESWSWLPY